MTLNRLAGIRKMRNITQAELSKSTGINHSQIGHFESGNRMPSVSNLIKLADGLGVSLDYIVGRGSGDYEDGYRRGAFDAREKMKAATRRLCGNFN